MAKKFKKGRLSKIIFAHKPGLWSLMIVIIISIMAVYTIVRAGDLEPSASPAGTMHSLLEMAAKDINDTFDRTTDSLEAMSEAIASLAANIWDKATSELTTAGSIGKLIVDNMDMTAATSTDTLFGWFKTTYNYTAPSSTALTTNTWTDARANYLDLLNSDLRFLISSSTASTTPFAGSIAYHLGSSTVATSTDTLFGWFKTNYDYTAPSSTALTTNTWTDARAGYLDALAQSGYSSTTIAANIDGNILERLEYLNNRSMFSVVNIKNGSATSPATDFAFYTQALGGVDDYNDNGARPTDSFAASWTQCAAANNYCKTGDSTACTGDVCYQDNNTGQIWSDYLDSGTNHNWWWANNCWAPGSWANPGTCTADGDDACQCVTATSTPNITGCKAIGDGNWRLPHQKELMQAYIDGSWGNLPHANFNFWSATTKSYSTHSAWYTDLRHGSTDTNLKTNEYDSRCVR
ncbi:DUF1566 domain-containing protein [Patescibacteria group bacterium]|nr:DUF1566 domain-containing protein [Patescibacteria group bacterium]